MSHTDPSGFSSIPSTEPCPDCEEIIVYGVVNSRSPDWNLGGIRQQQLGSILTGDSNGYPFSGTTSTQLPKLVQATKVTDKASLVAQSQKPEYCEMAQLGSDDFDDGTLAWEDEVFSYIGSMGDTSVVFGYMVAPFNPPLGGGMILVGKIASNAGSVVQYGAALSDYVNNGNTGRLVNSTMCLAGQLVAGNVGSKIGTKMFGNQQIRDAMGRFGKKRSEGMAQIGQMIGGKATLCQSN